MGVSECRQSVNNRNRGSTCHHVGLYWRMGCEHSRHLNASPATSARVRKGAAGVAAFTLELSPAYWPLMISHQDFQREKLLHCASPQCQGYAAACTCSRSKARDSTVSLPVGQPHSPL